MTGFAWTDDRVAELRQHFDANLTAGQIVQKMGGGLTRSAILGKLFRLGLRHDGLARGERTRQGIASAPRTPRTRTAPFRAPPVMVAPEAKPSPAVTAAPSGAHQCDIMGLTNTTCRFPVTADSPFLFCGEPDADVRQGVPYCRFHARIAFNGKPERRPQQYRPAGETWTTLGAAARNVVAGLKG